MPKEDKITAIERDRRIQLISEFLLKGLTRAQMIQYISDKKKWNLTDRQVDNYISSAKKIIKDTDVDKEFEIKRAKMRLDKLYSKNENDKDFKECRAIIESMAKLFGWNQPSKIDHTSNGETISYSTPEARDQKIRELLEKAKSK